jgi:hypothetical protein
MNNWCICWLTARRLYKSFGVKGLIVALNHVTESDPELFVTALLREVSCWSRELDWGILFLYSPGK